MANYKQQKPPNEALAEEIVATLSEAGLVMEKHKAELEHKLKAGGVTQEDWHLWIDLATVPDKNKERGDGENG